MIYQMTEKIRCTVFNAEDITYPQTNPATLSVPNKPGNLSPKLEFQQQQQQEEKGRRQGQSFPKAGVAGVDDIQPFNRAKALFVHDSSDLAIPCQVLVTALPDSGSSNLPSSEPDLLEVIPNQMVMIDPGYPHTWRRLGNAGIARWHFLWVNARQDVGSKASLMVTAYMEISVLLSRKSRQSNVDRCNLHYRRVDATWRPAPFSSDSA
ncbi:hypothetical protein C8Q80DRAFT_1124695 [Daedaleopsis nitida]|nr:hypothetical protein C8Q80DRAFT_1124695 [Daedaleopsis nitida]